MISRLLIPTLLALPLCAQAPAPVSAPAVHIILQADPPPAGTPALDTAAIAKALQDFATEHELVKPTPDGDGWALGIRLMTQEEPDGLLVAQGAMRLSRIEGGHILPDEAKDSEAVVVSREKVALTQALAGELVQRGEDLLTKAKVIPVDEPAKKIVVKTPKDEETVHEFDFSQVRIANVPVQPSYPRYAKANHIQGAVAVEIAVSPDGKPISASAIEGPPALLVYSLQWAMHWRFEPLTLNGHPESGKFRLNLNFKLD